MRTAVLLFVTFALTQTLVAQTPVADASVADAPVADVSVALTPAELKAKLPPIEGWTIVAEAEVYDSDNLYDKINGAAPGYFMFNFQELTVL